MEISQHKFLSNKWNIDFIKIRKINYVISIILVLLSIFSVLTLKFNLGTDFVGGTEIEIRISPSVSLNELRRLLHTIPKLNKVSIQNFGDNDTVVIRVPNIKVSSEIQSLTSEINELITQNLNTNVNIQKVNFVGPQVSTYLLHNGIKALIFALIGMVIYIWLRFKWQFSIGIMFTIIHDIILSIGFISFTRIEFDLSSITALLTIIGYSINDSIIIYDRIRENINKADFRNKNIGHIINISIHETLARTTLTVLTTLLATLALILFSGFVIRNFAVLIFIGIVIGTYSSIFISAPILLLFKIKNN